MIYEKISRPKVPKSGVLLIYLGIKKACPLIVEPNKGYLKQLKTRVEEKKLSPVVDTIFSLKKGNKRLETFRTGHVCGKVVLEIH